MLYPLTFHPIFKERVWGNRKLESLYHKHLPPNAPIGESWEISDRPGDISVIANGPLAGKDLHWLMTHHSEELTGQPASAHDRFPLLIKILDAQEKLSLQVHPPADKAAQLGGEPKTEFWYVANAAPGAELYVGLKRGVTRERFAEKIKSGTVAECFHRVAVRAGDAMFLPSGRVHALGAGLVIFEIQQNSDTTYRVFDWNRVGLDGKPRALHIEQSLASIDFNDFEPSLIKSEFCKTNGLGIRLLVHHPLFSIELWRSDNYALRDLKFHDTTTGSRKFQILACIAGSARVHHSDSQTNAPLSPGEFCLVPASLDEVTVSLEKSTELLRIQK